MNKTILLLLACFLSFTVIGQSKQVDSLLKLLDKEKADSNRLKIYRNIGNFYVDNNPGKAIEYFKNAVELSEKINNNAQLANNCYSIAFCYRNTGDYSKSVEYYLKAVRVYEADKDYRRLANAYLSLAIVYSYNKDFKNASSYHTKAKEIILIRKDSFQLCSLYTDIGTLFDQQKMYDSANKYQQQAYDLAVAIKDEQMIIDCLSNIGLTYKHEGKTKEALANFKKVLLVFQQQQTEPDRYAAVYNNIGATYAQEGNKTLAVEAFNKSLAYASASQNPYIEMENYNNLSDLFGKTADFKNQAFYLKKYYSIKDSLFSADKKNQLTQLEADYNIEKKNTEIVKKEGEVQIEKKQKYLSLTLALVAVVVLILITFFYNRIKNKNELLGKQNVQINNQKNELQSLNNVKDRLFSIISHDLRNPLVSLRSYFSLTENPDLSDEKKLAYKKQTLSAVTQTTSLLDNLLVWANMQIKESKPQIKIIDIEDAVLDAVDNVNAQAIQKKIIIQKNLEATAALGDQNIITIAVRNLLTNALKYSNENSTISINSFQNDKDINIDIADEGVGISAEKINLLLSNEADTTIGTSGEKGTGLGIFLVKELLQKINGELLIKSVVGEGSVFTIKLPAVNG